MADIRFQLCVRALLVGLDQWLAARTRPAAHAATASCVGAPWAPNPPARAGSAALRAAQQGAAAWASTVREAELERQLAERYLAESQALRVIVREPAASKRQLEKNEALEACVKQSKTHMAELEAAQQGKGAGRARPER